MQSKRFGGFKRSTVKALPIYKCFTRKSAKYQTPSSIIYVNENVLSRETIGQGILSGSHLTYI